MTNTSLFKRGFTAFLAMLVCLSSFIGLGSTTAYAAGEQAEVLAAAQEGAHGARGESVLGQLDPGAEHRRGGVRGSIEVGGGGGVESGVGGSVEGVRRVRGDRRATAAARAEEFVLGEVPMGKDERGG